MARLKHIIVMTTLGLVALAGIAITVVFAGIVALVAGIGLALMAVTALFTRKPLRVTVNARRPAPKDEGVLEARKNGSTWEVY